MSVLELFGLFDGQAASRRYLEQGSLQQERAADVHLLHKAGPGHMVLRIRWNDRQGWPHSEAKAFPINAEKEAEAWKQTIGWPGHEGGWWNYFKDDARDWIDYRRRKHCRSGCSVQ